MGNAQTSVTNVTVNGDGNVIRPSAEFQATAAPSFDLNPGVLNPNGNLYIEQPDMDATVTAQSLVLLHDKTGSPYAYVADNTRETLDKIVNYIANFQPLLEASGLTCPPRMISFYCERMSGYVGTSAITAINNPVEDGEFITQAKMAQFRKQLGLFYDKVKDWHVDLKMAQAMLPLNVPTGTYQLEFTSYRDFMTEYLPESNICKLYPDEALEVAANLIPAIRTGLTKEISDVNSTGLIAGAIMAPQEGGGSLTDGSNTGTSLLQDVASMNANVITASSTIPVSSLNVIPEPKSFSYDSLAPDEVYWIQQVPSVQVRFSVDVETVTYYMGFEPAQVNTVIDLRECSSASFVFDLTGTQFAADYPTSKLGLLMIRLTDSITAVTPSTEIKANVLEISDATIQQRSRKAVSGLSQLATTVLTYTYEREVLPNDDAYYYLVPCTMQPTAYTALNYPCSVGGTLTVTPIDNTEVTVNGIMVDSIIPSELIGSQTEEEQMTCLPNEAAELLKHKVQICAGTIAKMDPSGVSEDTPAVAAVAGILALQNETRAVRLDIKSLFSKARRAINMLVGRPSTVLGLAKPVISDPNVWMQIATGVAEAVASGNVNSAMRDSARRLAALRSVSGAKGKLLSLVAQRFPPNP
ncbi:VP4 [Reovirus GCRV104]|nr:VP4 [Reovirus GCRV104]